MPINRSVRVFRFKINDVCIIVVSIIRQRVKISILIITKILNVVPNKNNYKIKLIVKY